MSNKLTVLMAVNKIDKHLSPSINSILTQDFTDFTFLIICNGHLRTKVSEYIRHNHHDERIQIYEIELEGLAFALNYGINLTNTKYIARQDADDISLKNRLSSQYNFLEKNNDYGVVGCKVTLIDDEDKELKDKFFFVKDDSSIRKILPIHNPLCHPALMFRRDMLLEVKGYLYGYFSEDHDLFLRISNTTDYKLHNIDNIMFHYRRHSNQLTSKINKKIFSEITGLHTINIIGRYNYKSILGILWILPPIVFLKRQIRNIIRKYF